MPRVTSADRTSLTRTLLAPNPGPMTLEGTNTYLVGAGRELVVVDPGPADAAHLDRIAAAGDVALILVSHRHPDHTDGIAGLVERTGAPVRAISREFCVDGDPLVDGEVIEVAGTQIEVVATPGHTADSVSFHLPDDGATGSMLTGDTILGQGTTIIAWPDGALRPYLASLHRLLEFPRAAVLPGHGPRRPNLRAVAYEYLAHRGERLEQVRAALAELGEDTGVEAVTDAVYADVDPAVRPAAEASVRAQLDYLRGA